MTLSGKKKDWHMLGGVDSFPRTLCKTHFIALNTVSTRFTHLIHIIEASVKHFIVLLLLSLLKLMSYLDQRNLNVSLFLTLRLKKGCWTVIIISLGAE